MLTIANGKASVLWVLRSTLNPTLSILPHDHAFHTFLLLKRESLRMTVGEETREVSVDDIVFIPAGATHGFVNPSSDKSATYYELKFAVIGDELEEIVQAIPSWIGKSPFVAACIDEMVKESIEEVPSPEKAFEIYLLALLSYFSNMQSIAVARAPKVPEVPAYSAVEQYTDMVQQVISYLHDHYDSAIRLDDVAETIGVSKPYMCSAFKKETGSTIGHYLTDIRVKKAANLLVSGNTGLSDIAKETGFSSVSHFNKVFSSYAGISPGQYRRAFPQNVFDSNQIPSYYDDHYDGQKDRFSLSVLAHKRFDYEALRRSATTDEE